MITLIRVIDIILETQVKRHHEGAEKGVEVDVFVIGEHQFVGRGVVMTAEQLVMWIHSLLSVTTQSEQGLTADVVQEIPIKMEHADQIADGGVVPLQIDAMDEPQSKRHQSAQFFFEMQRLLRDGRVLQVKVDRQEQSVLLHAMGMAVVDELIAQDRHRLERRG